MVYADGESDWLKESWIVIERQDWGPWDVQLLMGCSTFLPWRAVVSWLPARWPLTLFQRWFGRELRRNWHNKSPVNSEVPGVSLYRHKVNYTYRPVFALMMQSFCFCNLNDRSTLMSMCWSITSHDTTFDLRHQVCSSCWSTINSHQQF